MQYIKIDYAGAMLEIDTFLAEIWPFDFPLEKWPTFCGAGDGIGDWIVPDVIKGVRVAPACLGHDVDWAIADGSWRMFQAANNRFRRNLRALIKAQLTGWRRHVALARCDLYWLVVSSPIGWSNYDPYGGDDIRKNPVVKARLQRLARATMGIGG